MVLLYIYKVYTFKDLPPIEELVDQLQPQLLTPGVSAYFEAAPSPMEPQRPSERLLTIRIPADQIRKHSEQHSIQQGLKMAERGDTYLV